MIEATTDRNRIMVRGTTYDQKDAAKSVKGCLARWDEKVRPKRFLGWSYPLTIGTCKALRQAFGRDLKVLPPLAEWFREEVARQAAMEEARTGQPADLARVLKLAPEMYMAMQARPYQPVGAGFMLEGRQVILGDDPGLGKTMQTLATCIEDGAQNILVLCPKTTTGAVWQKETLRWAPNIRVFVAQGTRKQREDTMRLFDTAGEWEDHPRLLVCNTEMVRAKRWWVCPDGTRLDKPPRRKGGCKQNHEHKTDTEYTWPFLFERAWDAIIMDESQNSLASMYNVQSVNITQVRLGAMHLRKKLVPNGLALPLSGTPFRGKLPRAWGTLNWIRPDVFPSFWKWAEEYFQVTEDASGYGGSQVNPKPKDPDRFNAMLRPYYLGRDKATAAPDLPPVQYMGTYLKDDEKGLRAVWLEMEGQQAKAYASMAKDASADVKNGTIMATGVLAEITRLRQLASSYGRMEHGEFYPALPSNKVEAIMQFLMEHEGHDTKVVIASEFTRLIEMAVDAIEKELGIEVLKLTGATTQSRRTRNVERFQDPDDPARVFAINLKAGGVGITLDAADYMHLLDTPWDADAERQMVDRIHRVSRIHNVMVYRYLSLGTIDEWMAGLSAEQRRILLSSNQEAIELAKDGLAA